MCHEAFAIIIGLVEFLFQNRKYPVRINDVTSKPFSSSSGVPQRSNLGLLLFIMYNNDVTSILPSHNCLMYADDIRIFHLIRLPSVCIGLQKLIYRFCEWFENNSLSIINHP